MVWICRYHLLNLLNQCSPNCLILNMAVFRKHELMALFIRRFAWIALHRCTTKLKHLLMHFGLVYFVIYFIIFAFFQHWMSHQMNHIMLKMNVIIFAVSNLLSLMIFIRIQKNKIAWVQMICNSILCQIKLSLLNQVRYIFMRYTLFMRTRRF